MRCVSFRRAGEREVRFGALVDGGRRILDFHHPATGVEAPANPLDWFDLSHPASQTAAARWASVTSDEELLEELVSRGAIPGHKDADLFAPVPEPRSIIGIGRNYADHAAERGAEVPETPLLFAKASSAVVGPGQAIVLPEDSRAVDFEAELGVVMGRRARGVSEDEALEYVFGYTIMNDVTARDFQRDDRTWLRAKGCDTFAPMGPYVADRDAIPDPSQLPVKLRLNGETMQDGNTRDLVFSIPRLIAHITRFRTLYPGDLIATGTPAGVGAGRTPPVFLRDGDRIEIEIDGLGVLRNQVRAGD